MLFVGFLWTFAHVVLALIILTLIGYQWPSSLIGKTANTIK
jgi:hypothetical protein